MFQQLHEKHIENGSIGGDDTKEEVIVVMDIDYLDDVEGKVFLFFFLIYKYDCAGEG